MNAVLLVHAGATCFMAGLIWFVQVVHYPLLARVATDHFAGYARAHQARTTGVVAPVMLVEAATAVAIAVSPPGGAPAVAWIALALLAIVWLSTALIQVPCHRQLEAGFAMSAHRRLVASNWIRTIGWTARAAIALWLLRPGS